MNESDAAVRDELEELADQAQVTWDAWYCGKDGGTVSDRMVRSLLWDLSDRQGMGFDNTDAETMLELVDTWKGLIEAQLPPVVQELVAMVRDYGDLYDRGVLDMTPAGVARMLRDMREMLVYG
tara:strand:- start:908 stop:1276 length:369 start_codon:yes stop_codon:yes gene_type:complete